MAQGHGISGFLCTFPIAASVIYHGARPWHQFRLLTSTKYEVLTKKESTMKRSLATILLSAVIVLFIGCQTTYAQSPNPARPTSEQSLADLVSEVRQLRAMLQRLNKGQVMLERMKLEQEQVASLSRELNNVTDALSENRLQKSKMQDLLPGVQSGVEAGAINPKELTGLKTEIDLCSQRELMLVERQTRLSADLNSAQARLTVLRERLNALELEIAPE